MRAFIFPGQGSQTVGMGKALAEAFASARAVFEEVDEALQQRLSRLMWQGPESELTLTENTQPAIMAASLAIIRALQQGGALDLARHARLVAGHSAGEYAALCAAGAFTLSDTAKLLRLRGQAMQAAVPVGEGGMTALIGIEMAAAEEAVKEASALGIVVIANDNAPGQIVISGATKALAKAAEISEPAAIRDLLVEQLTARVRWRESVASFRELGVAMTVETGGNKVLTGMVKRIDKQLEPVSLDSPADIEAFAKTL